MNKVTFEFDPDISASNKEKHGIDFVEAQSLWDGPDLIEIPAKSVCKRSEPISREIE